MEKKDFKIETISVFGSFTIWFLKKIQNLRGWYFQMKKRSKILGLVIVIMMIVVLAIGVTTTGAWFSDKETSTGNTFAAGTLDLNVDGGNTNVVKFAVNNMKPGDQPTGSWTLANVGSVNGYLDLEAITVTNTENGITEPEAEAGDITADIGELQNVVNLRLYIDKDKDGYLSTGDVTIYNGPTGNIAGNYNQNELIAAGSNARINAVFDWWATPNDNKAMGDGLTLNLTYELAQTPEQ